MTRIEDISWGSYQEFEGPFYRGKVKFELPLQPTLADKRLAAITAIESGHYDAINMYDRMILTVGLIQWGEANTFSVSKMLGFICDAGYESIVQAHLKPALEASGASFKMTLKNGWRFFIGSQEVNSVKLQQDLFLGCDGRKGKWTEASKLYAKRWAACVSSLFADPQIREIQKKYTADRLLGFVMADAKKGLFEDKNPSPWAEATRTIFLTYAINLPRVAGEMYTTTKFVGDKWSPEWCLCLIKRLTFGPGIKIYPKRYNAVRPVIEKLFEIELPKSADELQAWKPAPPSTPTVIEQPSVGKSEPPKIDPQIISELNQIVNQNPPAPQPSFFEALLSYIKKLFTR